MELEMPATRTAPVAALVAAAEEVALAGRHSVRDRFALFRTEAASDARSMAVSAGSLAFAAGLAGLGWVLVVLGAIATLVRALDPALALLIAALPHLAVGALALWVGVRFVAAQRWGAPGSFAHGQSVRTPRASDGERGRR
jgi:hypothetical protein